MFIRIIDSLAPPHLLRFDVVMVKAEEGVTGGIEMQHQKHHSLTDDAEVAFSLVGYSTCSISMILLNKLVIDTYKIDYPMGLLFMQNFCAWMLVVVLKRVGLVHYPDFDLKVVKRWLPLTILFVAMLYTSMKSLKIMSVAVQTILKNIAIVLTAFGDQYLFNKRVTKEMYVSFSLMVLGSYLGSVGDRWVTSWGLFWTFCNIFSTVAYVLYMKDLLSDVSREIGRYGPVFYNNLLSLPFIFPSCVMTLPDMIDTISHSSIGATVCLGLMVVVGSVMTFASFWCMKVTSPTTYSVTGALNKIPLALLGIFIFGHVPSGIGWLGIAVALCGGVWYTWLSRPKPVPEHVEEGRRVV